MAKRRRRFGVNPIWRGRSCPFDSRRRRTLKPKYRHQSVCISVNLFFFSFSLADRIVNENDISVPWHVSSNCSTGAPDIWPGDDLKVVGGSARLCKRLNILFTSSSAPTNSRQQTLEWKITHIEKRLDILFFDKWLGVNFVCVFKQLSHLLWLCASCWPTRHCHRF